MRRRYLVVAALAVSASNCTTLKPATDQPDVATPRDVTVDATADVPVDDLAFDAPADVAADHADAPPDVPVDAGPMTTTDPTQISPPRPIAPLSGSVIGARMPSVRFVMPGGFTTGVRVDVCLDRDCTAPAMSYTPTVTALAGTVVNTAVALPTGSHQFFWRLRGISGSGPAATSGSATSAPWLLQVDPPATETNLVQPSLRDLDRNGYADLYVGAPRDITWCCNEGRAHAFLGQAAAPGINTADAAAYQYPGGMLQQNPDAGTGTGSAIVGDMDGDGFADTAAGGPCLGGTGSTCGPGAVAVSFGGATGATTAPLMNGSGGSMEHFGTTVAGLADFNGDGLADLAIGVPQAGGEAGALVLARTTPSGGVRRTLSSFRVTPTGDAHLGGLGNSLASAGDVDGDGLTDVIIGAPNTFGYIGAAYLVFGTTAWTDAMTSPSPAYIEVTAPFTGTANFGRAVGGAGDIDGDGYADFIISGPTHGGGSVMVYFGGHDARTSVPTRTIQLDAPAGTYFGQSAAGVGDLNGDGYGDIAVGSLNPTTNMADGVVRVYLGGPAGLLGATPTVPAVTLGPVSTGGDGGSPLGSTTGEYGYAMAAAGDVNGDGFGDLIVSAPIAPAFHDPSSGTFITFGGRVMLYFGTSTGVNATPVVLPATDVEPGSMFGASLSRAEPGPASRNGGRV